MKGSNKLPMHNAQLILVLTELWLILDACCSTAECAVH